MKLPEKGKSKEEVLQQLRENKSKDFDWKSGKLFTSVYYPGEEKLDLLYQAYNMYLSENLVDPTLFPSLRNMETEVVSMCRDILQGDENVSGSLTTGGTESILLAMRTAKKWAKKEKGIENPEMIVTYTVHAAFFKAAEYFGIKMVLAPINEEYKTDVNALKGLINKNTAVIVASAPSFAYSVIDPITEIGKVAQEHNVLFHVDSCIGGMVLGFYRQQKNITPFDFSVPGVTSISMDLHKYGYTAKGCSVVLYKNKSIWKNQFFVCSEWSGYALVNPTVLSTRTGGPIAAAWAMFNYLGKEGYMDIAKRTMEATHKYIEGVRSIDELKIIGSEGECSMLTFASDEVNVFELNDEMKEMGWGLNPQFSNKYAPSNLHLTISLSNTPHVNDFVEDMKKAVVAVKKGGLKKAIGNTAVSTVSKLAGSMGPGTFEKIAKVLGIGGGKIPKKLATASKLMDSLPDDVVKALLTEYASKFYDYNDNR